MRLSLHKLHNLPVETQAGQSVGRVVDVELDAETQSVQTYHIRSRTFIPGLFEQKLLIDRRQVISLTEEKLIVEDAVSAELRGTDAAPEPDVPASA